jgi:uncharacterized protein YkwD
VDLTPSPRRPRRLLLEELESRLVLSGYQPTAQEQMFLELLNDARANPAAYGASIGLDLSYVAPAAPLAFDTLIQQAAQLDAQDMNNRAFFGHTNPDGLDPGARLTNAGYPWTTWGESIAAGGTLPSPAEALRALIIDAGVPDLGHRNHLLGIGYPDNLQSEVGIGMVQNGSGPYSNYYVIDTGATRDTRPFLTGVVYNDTNANGHYDVGEGLGGVTITVAGVGSTYTFGSGGYSFQLSPGTYTVTASGGGLAAPITQTVWVGSANVRLNFVSDPKAVAHLQDWVKLLYHDLLHRTPAAGEVNYWVGGIQQGVPQSAVVAGLLASQEYDANVVTQIYQQYLHRAPDGGGLAGFVAALQNGASEPAVRLSILSSAEYWGLHGGNASGFVQGLYTDLMGRSPAGHEADYWVNLAQSSGPTLVAAGFLGSREFDSRVVENLYRTYLRRSADAGGLNFFVNYMLANRPAHYGVELFLESAEYFDGSLTW